MSSRGHAENSTPAGAVSRLFTGGRQNGCVAWFGAGAPVPTERNQLQNIGFQRPSADIGYRAAPAKEGAPEHSHRQLKIASQRPEVKVFTFEPSSSSDEAQEKRPQYLFAMPVSRFFSGTYSSSNGDA